MGRQVVSDRDLVRTTSDYRSGPSAPDAEPEVEDELALSPNTRSESTGDSGPIPREEIRVDDYGSRLVKYVPTEIVALYITLSGIVDSGPQSQSRDVASWVIVVFGFLVTPLYLWRVQKVKKSAQLLISTGAYLVWVIAVHTPASWASVINPMYGALLLPIYTFLAALVIV